MIEISMIKFDFLLDNKNVSGSVLSHIKTLRESNKLTTKLHNTPLYSPKDPFIELHFEDESEELAFKLKYGDLICD